MMRYCKNCGTQLKDGVSFCPKCGNPVGQPGQAAPNVGYSQSGQAAPNGVYGNPTPQKGNKKAIGITAGIIGLIVAAVVLISVFVTGCYLGHDWQEADCTTPATCVKCGKTEGEALGHTWVDASCSTPKTCSVCGKSEGGALGHDWKQATCIIAKTCKICGETIGNPLDHDWQEATCTKPNTCANCRQTDGEALGHMLNSGGFCLRCDGQFGKEITKDTLEDYFEITWSDQTVSPFTITVKPKSSGYTYGGGRAPGGYMKPFILVDIRGLRTSTDPQHRSYDVVYEETISISLDERGYGSITYNWSGTGAIRVSIPNMNSIKLVAIYCYPKQ